MATRFMGGLEPRKTRDVGCEEEFGEQRKGAK